MNRIDWDFITIIVAIILLTFLFYGDPDVMDTAIEATRRWLAAQ